jgi:S-adenosylmethionine uptake transporter
MQYVHLVFATIMGWGVFGHLPDVISMLGMMLIICGGVAVALHTQFKRNSPAE